MFKGLRRFQISGKWANLRFPLNIQKQKVFQLQGGFAPLTPPTRGSAMPPLPNPKYATDYYFTFSIIFTISCNQKGSVTLRMHQIRFSPGLCPGPRWGSSWRSPRVPSRLGRRILSPHRRLRRLTLSLGGLLQEHMSINALE